MSELKWNWVYYPYLDAPNEQEESALKAGYIKVVDKSEADKVISRHKYKRCLAMARWCHNESLWWYSKGYGFEKYDKFCEKWEKRWLEIAEQFKDKEEAK